MEGKSNRIYLLEEAGVASALLKLGIPTMSGMLISALYNAVDAYFVSGLGMMFWAGAASYISRLLGKGDNERHR